MIFCNVLNFRPSPCLRNGLSNTVCMFTDMFGVLWWELGSAVDLPIETVLCTAVFGTVQKSTGPSELSFSSCHELRVYLIFQTNLVTQDSKMGIPYFGGIKIHLPAILEVTMAPPGIPRAHRKNRGPCLPLLSWLQALLRCNWWMLGWHVGSLPLLEALCISIPLVHILSPHIW